MGETHSSASSRRGVHNTGKLEVDAPAASSEAGLLSPKATDERDSIHAKII